MTGESGRSSQRITPDDDDGPDLAKAMASRVKSSAASALTCSATSRR